MKLPDKAIIVARLKNRSPEKDEGISDDSNSESGSNHLQEICKDLIDALSKKDEEAVCDFLSEFINECK